MAYLGESDIPAQLAGLGALPISLGGEDTIGLVGDPQEELLEEGESAVVGGLVQVTIQTGTLTSLAPQQAITVDGEAMVVHRHRRIDDGALTIILCAKA